MNTERAVAKLFTSNCLNAIANNDFSSIKKLKVDEIAEQFHAKTYQDLYEKSYAFLEKNYRNEYIYKNIIARKILIGHHSLKSSTMLSEFRVGTNKADLVLLNGCSTCYEIKTEYDSLVRLEDQLRSYTKLFTKVFVVCASKMITEVLLLTPLNVGVIEFTETCKLKTIREPIENSSIDSELMMKSLRKEEYLSIAEQIYKLKIDVPNTQIFDFCSNIINKAEPELVHKLFLKTLKETRRNNEKAIKLLPKSLTNALISFKFNNNNIKSLIKIFTEHDANVLSNFEGKTQ
ncbi:sce7726 family protein [Acinetobacter defluvii]|uniref:sce7726 family protein n=1 Tax=Acinetobacter defluvii TaxID=1871111 RepID=UPI003AF45FDB